MPEEELDQAFKEGRLTRRAFVRQLVAGGMPMTAALSYADSLSPPESSVVTEPVATPDRTPVPRSERPCRVDGIDVNFVGDGYIVYQPTRDRVHSLNHTAALVLELCTGENDAPEIARLLQRCYDLPDPPNDEVRQCLGSLFEEGLIH